MTGPDRLLTVLTLERREASDDGRLTKQFWRWTREISAAVDCAFFLGAIFMSVDSYYGGDVVVVFDIQKFKEEEDVQMEKDAR